MKAIAALGIALTLFGCTTDDVDWTNAFGGRAQGRDSLDFLPD